MARLPKKRKDGSRQSSRAGDRGPERLERRVLLCAGDGLTHGAGCCCAECSGCSAVVPEPEAVICRFEMPLAADGIAFDEISSRNYGIPFVDTFSLHSRPAATKTIYLDFTGHITEGTGWTDIRNGSDRIETPAYDTDGSPLFSEREQLNIQEVWLRVAEDFSPFDVNVTTEEPVLDDLMNSGGADERWGIRVVIGGDNDWLGDAGGVAFLNSFSSAQDVPCFVFSENMRNGVPKPIAEAVSHEIGHTLGLTHDGEFPDTEFDTYYGGHGSGSTGWAPIMGVGYSRQLVQWSSGEYAFANNPQDDLAVITGGNGFGFRIDDFGNDIETAFDLMAEAAETVPRTTLKQFTVSGVIEQRNDVDLFAFSTEGAVEITVYPSIVSPNLDIEARLLDANGGLIRQSNPVDELSAGFDFRLGKGDYFLQIDGTGKDDPYGGYSDYSSLGQYTIELTVDAGEDVDGGGGQLPDGNLLPEISIESAMIAESGQLQRREAVFKISLSEPVNHGVLVEVQTNSDSAVVNEDFVGKSQIAIFRPGQVEAEFVVKLVGDEVAEEDEIFWAVLSNPIGGTVTGQGRAEGKIFDDDRRLVTVSEPVMNVVEGQAFVVTILLNEPSELPIQVSYATVDGSATFRTDDYLPIAGRLTILPGEMTGELQFPIGTVLVDGKDEGSEYFEIRLLGPLGANLGVEARVFVFLADSA